MKRFAALLTIMGFTAVPFSALAQVSGFELSGIVQDESGAMLPGATLTLSNSETGLSRTVTTNERGRYVFGGMPAGTYGLRVELSGFASAEYAGLRYYANTKETLNVTLSLAQVQEAVTVTGEAPLLDTRQAQIGLTVDDRQIEQLPLLSRDYLDLVTLASGVNPASADVVLGSVGQNVNGSYIRYTSYQLDGFNNNRDQHGVAKVDLGMDSVEEFRVITNQFSAEYGQSMAGIISAITKSGTNEFHGTGFAFIRPGGLDAANPLTGAETTLNRQDLGFTFSGPILRDRTHFFVSYEYRNQEEDAEVTASIADGAYRGVFPLEANRSRLLGKVNHLFNPAHQMEAKFFLNDDTIQTGIGGLQIAENVRDNFNDDKGFQALVTSVRGSSMVNELRVGFIDENYESVAPFALESGLPVLSYPGQGTIGNNNRFQSANEDQWEISDTVSIFRGAHSLKTGFDVYKIDTIADLQVFFDGGYNFAPGAPYPYDPGNPASYPILYTQGFFAPGAPTVLDRSETHFQAYLQDDWQISADLTLNLGVRWEKETSVPDNDNFAPRFGFNWVATEDGRTSVRGGYGIFYSYIFSAIESFEIFTGPEGFFTASLSPGDPLFPEPPTGKLPGPHPPEGFTPPPADLYYSAPDYAPEFRKSPYTHHFTVGVQRQLGQALAAAIDLTFIKGEDLILPLDVNGPSYFDYATGLTRSASAADATRPFGVPGRPIAAGETPYVTSDFPFSGYRLLRLLASRGNSEYWAIKTRIEKRYSDNFMLQGIYTWSRIENDGDSFRDNSLPQNPNDLDAEWGRGETDVPHSLAVNGIYDGPWGLRLSGILRWRSGEPVNPLVGRDLNGDRRLIERPFSNGTLLPRNSFREESFTSTDLSISKIIRLTDDQSLEGRFEVFNLFNALNPDSVTNTYGANAENPLPEFLRINSVFPGRQFQVSVRYRF
jgi:hypothetical protein